VIFDTVSAQPEALRGFGRNRMKIVIGANADDAGRDALALGSLLCRALGATPLLCHVHPAAFNYPSPGHVDTEWRAYLHGEAEKVLAGARESMMADFGWPDVACLVGEHKASGQGLADVASQENADMIVIGSAPGGRPGTFHIGSTANKLLHGSPVPVAVAPEGYRHDAPASIGQVLAGFRDTSESVQALAKAAEFAEAAGVPLVVLTILIRHRIYGSQLGASAEEAVVVELQRDNEAAQTEALERLGIAQEGVRRVTAVADSPRAALQRIEWTGDELLVLGSARGGPLQRVFLGDMTYKILRATPVPTVVLPHLSEYR